MSELRYTIIYVTHDNASAFHCHVHMHADNVHVVLFTLTTLAIYDNNIHIS